MPKHEIFNNGKRVLHSDDNVSIPVIWNNITGKYSTKQEHCDYLRYIKSRGFEDGLIELKEDGITIKSAEIKLP
jgi:hypothetical protein